MLPEEIIKKFENLTNLGVTYFILYFNNVFEKDFSSIELFSKKVIPKINF
jgi:hypothetical protein